VNDKYFLRADEQVRSSFLLARKIYDSGFIPDALVVLWRGGTPIGVVIHEFLAFKGIETYHTAIKVVSYAGIGDRREPRVEQIDRLLAFLRPESRVLIVDDIFDSGSTMEKVVEALLPHVREIRVATLFYKEASNVTSLVPDYYQYKTDNWIVFPHELSGLSMEEIRLKDPFVYELLTIEA
jgi:uncharacterized protein